MGIAFSFLRLAPTASLRKKNRIEMRRAELPALCSQREKARRIRTSRLMLRHTRLPTPAKTHCRTTINTPPKPKRKPGPRINEDRALKNNNRERTTSSRRPSSSQQ
jgi:hypothetical protein